MAVSSSSMAQITRPGVKPKEAGLNDDAKIRRKYGIAPKGKPPKGGWPDSAYGYPVPPADHPQAVKYARAVLSRAHQNSKFAQDDLNKQIKKAQAVLKKHDPNYKPSPVSHVAKGKSKESVREAIPSTPPGSWERVSGMIQKAAQASKLFGGPANDDPKLDSSDTVRSWDIFIYASYPAKNTVVIANDKSGNLWNAQYAIKDGQVTFSNVKPVKLAFAQEVQRRKIHHALRASWKPLREGLHFEGKLREANLEKGTARVVIICAGPGNSADKHYYTPECLEDAVERKVFEGAQCYLDHPTKLEDEIIPERMVEKLAGWFSDVTLSQTDNGQGITVNCIEATFTPEPGNEIVMTKLRAAQQYAQQFDGASYLGFSINAAGVGAPAEIDGRQYNRVDRITEAISVDMVTRAGAGGKLLQLKESQRKAKEMKTGLKTNLVRSIKGAIKEAGIGLSEEQDEALDKALGIEDGGALDNLLDQVTMGGSDSDSTDDADLGEDGLDGAEDGDEDASDDSDGDAAGAGADDEDEDDDVESMDESALKAALKAARKKERAAEKAAKEAAKEAKEAKREANKAKIAAQGIVRERARVQIFEDLKIPASHRPILERHMRQDTTAKEMRETAIAYAKANSLSGESAANGGVQKAASFKLDCLAD